MPHLSPREHQICLLLPTGATNKQIGAKLKLSEVTVKEHLARVFQKTCIHNRTELAVYYLRRSPLMARSGGRGYFGK
jgi:DNA-binding NarL/FixJ family response regulator